jgi:glycosyltransferase involved in cell wall biosynthesis
LIQQLGIEDKVYLLGAYPSERISKVYTAADVFVLPSRFDGWGAVLNEAASLGLPLIGTDLCGASWHVIGEGLNGYRVPAASAGKLARAMRAYVGSPALTIKHGAASRDLFFQEFTPEKNAERLINSLRTRMPA